MNTQQRIDKVAEELRDIYKNTNEGPKMIHDLVQREFPYPRKVWNEPEGNGKPGGYGIATTTSVAR
jgi:hypothetical protein